MPDKFQIDKTRASEQSRNESLIREGSVFQVGTLDRITKFLAVGGWFARALDWS
jgi:hypothetical protein